MYSISAIIDSTTQDSHNKKVVSLLHKILLLAVLEQNKQCLASSSSSV